MKLLLINIDKGWGGGQEHMKVLAGQFRQKGHSVDFLCREGSPSHRSFFAEGYGVHGYSAVGISGGVAAVLRMARLFRRERFDAVLVEREHDLFRSAIAWLLAFPFGSGSRFVACYHTATSRRQLMLGTADAVVCISNHVKNKLLAGNPGLRVPLQVLHNGISSDAPVVAEKFSMTRQRRYFKGYDFPVIGMVGAFFKNQPELVEAIPFLKEAFPAIRVVLVGDDTDRGLTQPIMARAEQLGVTANLVLTGKLPHELMDDLYFDFDLTVSTFRNEGFGLIHLESLAAGTPVVCYKEGGQRDILEGGEAGLLVDGGVREFAAAVISLLKDHQRRFEMGRAGVDLVRTRFSAEAMAARYLELLSGVSSGPKG